MQECGHDVTCVGTLDVTCVAGDAVDRYARDVGSESQDVRKKFFFVH